VVSCRMNKKVTQNTLVQGHGCIDGIVKIYPMPHMPVVKRSVADSDNFLMRMV